MEKYLGTAVLFVVFLGHCSCDCHIPTYGFQCGYQCHCLPGDCDSTSGCNSGRCSPGWSGETCHKHNVALNKGVSSSGDPLMPDSRAIDGKINDRNYAGCIETEASNPNWWRVDLNDTVLIHDVTIYFRTDYTHRRNGIQVYLTNTTTTTITPSGVLCYTVTGNILGTDISNTLSVPCHVRGRYVLLYTTTANCGDTLPKMDFCEVEVNVCDPGTFGDDCENYCHCKDGVCNDITGVCPPECVDNVEYGPGCGSTCSSRKCKEAASPCPRDTGRCDGGCQPGWEGEDCTSECSDTYGDGCSKSCSIRHCGTASSCDHVTGACDNGCSVGWKDVDCSTECVDGVEYGVECVKNCSTRMCQGYRSPCPRDTGRCDGGCQAGWEGEDCTSECTLNVNYGPGCHGNCSARKCKEVSGTCPLDTGRCDGGCHPGWEGVDCMLECPSRTFGVNCSSTCGHCVDDEPCHHVTRTCLKGCSPGWVSDTCQQECQSRTFGVNCSSTCGHCMDDEPCHHVTGTCLKGCSPGWVSDTCRQVSSLPGNSTGRISPLAAGFIGAFAMLVIVAAVCLWRKGDFKMANTTLRQPPTPESSTAPPVEALTYDVLPEHDYTKLDRIHTEHYETLQPTVDYQNSDVRI